MFKSLQQSLSRDAGREIVVEGPLASEVFGQRGSARAFGRCLMSSAGQVSEEINRRRKLPSQLLQHDHVVAFIGTGTDGHSQDVGDPRGERVAVTSAGLTALVNSDLSFIRGHRLQA